MKTFTTMLGLAGLACIALPVLSLPLAVLGFVGRAAPLAVLVLAAGAGGHHAFPKRREEEGLKK